MKVDIEYKYALRRYLIRIYLRALETNPNIEEKIKVQKDILENSLFDLNLDTGFKYLVFSGPFLQKIDLSEISFDNVDWSNCTYKDLSFTNAKIDFSKSANTLEIKYTNLEGIDLSEAHFNIFKKIFDCNISNTNAKVNLQYLTYMQYTSLSGINLHNQEITFNDYLNKFKQNNFRDTGLKIKLSNMELENDIKLLSYDIQSDYLTNCYINEIKIKTMKKQNIKMKKITN